MSIEYIFCAGMLFLFFYLGALQKNKFLQSVFVALFFIISLVTRGLVDFTSNKDFYAYYNLYRIEQPEYWWEYFTNEPYLYFLYSFFFLFFEKKMEVFEGMYYVNYFFVTIFFIWLMKLKDVFLWKKVLFFSMYYFLFSFVLIRNGVPYMIFAYFIYLIYRGKTTKLVYLTPLMHISSSAPMIMVFHKHKKYIFYLLLVGISALFIIFVGATILNRPEFGLIAHKLDAYGKVQEETSVFHYIYFGIMSIFCFILWFFTRKRFFNPVIITTLFVYLAGFMINPVVGFRFSPYLMMAILLMNVDGKKYKFLNGMMNIGALLLVAYFIFTLYDTHFF